MDLRAHQLFEKATQARKADDLNSAISFLVQGLALQPNHAFFWGWLGALYSELEQYTAARAAFDRAIQLDPTLARAHAGLGEALGAIGRFDEAEAELKESIRLRPDATLYVLLGDVQLSMGRGTAATDSFEQALRLEPDNEEALFNLGVQERTRNPKKARDLFERAISVAPRFAAAYRELGFVFGRQRQFAAAQQAIETSIEFDAEDPWAHVYLANILWSRGQEPEAEAAYLRACELAPTHSYPLVALGEYYLAHDQLTCAQQAFVRATKTDPEDADAAYGLAHSFADLGFRTDANQWVSRALQLDGDHAKALELKRRLDDSLF